MHKKTTLKLQILYIFGVYMKPLTFLLLYAIHLFSSKDMVLSYSGLYSSVYGVLSLIRFRNDFFHRMHK